MDVPDSLLMKSVHQIPLVTICTDASYDPGLGIGAWACFIRTDDRIIKTGKIIAIDIQNSTEAERIGVASALWIVNKIVDIKRYRIIIYCDNAPAMKPLRPSTKTGTKKQRAKQQLVFYQKNIEPYLQRSLTYDIRHVKGHLERTAKHMMRKRHYMNDWADKEARRLLTEYRKTIDL